jgi:hypothetical protein
MSLFLTTTQVRLIASLRYTNTQPPETLHHVVRVNRSQAQQGWITSKSRFTYSGKYVLSNRVYKMDLHLSMPCNLVRCHRVPVKTAPATPSPTHRGQLVTPVEQERNSAMGRNLNVQIVPADTGHVSMIQSTPPKAGGTAPSRQLANLVGPRK